MHKFNPGNPKHDEIIFVYNKVFQIEKKSKRSLSLVDENKKNCQKLYEKLPNKIAFLQYNIKASETK